MRKLRKAPGMVFIVDPSRETLAALEANKLGIPVVGTADTNVNPDQLQYPIPVNDDAIKCIRLICASVADAVIEGAAIRAARLPELEAQEAAAAADGAEPVSGKHENEALRVRRCKEQFIANVSRGTLFSPPALSHGVQKVVHGNHLV